MSNFFKTESKRIEKEYLVKKLSKFQPPEKENIFGAEEQLELIRKYSKSTQLFKKR